MSKKYLFLLACGVAFCGVAVGFIRKKNKAAAVACNDKKSCVGNKDCQCYCSKKCGFRDKTDDDREVYVENDPNGKYCYCKQWDLDNYEINCGDQNY